MLPERENTTTTNGPLLWHRFYFPTSRRPVMSHPSWPGHYTSLDGSLVKHRQYIPNSACLFIALFHGGFISRARKFLVDCKSREQRACKASSFDCRVHDSYGADVLGLPILTFSEAYSFIFSHIFWPEFSNCAYDSIHLHQILREGHHYCTQTTGSAGFTLLCIVAASENL